METAAAQLILRGMAEYGILGLGWVLFIFSMMYIRLERKRYQDLVVHIITYFTKIHMLEGKHDASFSISPTQFTQERDNETGPGLGYPIDSKDHENTSVRGRRSKGYRRPRS